MYLPRFKIARLMVVIAVSAVFFAVLKSTTDVLISGLFTGTVVVLLTAVLGAVACRRRARMAWLGFAVFGWAYLAAAFGPWPWLNADGLRPPPLLTTKLIMSCQTRFPFTFPPDTLKVQTFWPSPFQFRSASDLSYTNPYGPNGGAFPAVIFNDSPVKQAGHSFGALLFGSLGAGLGRVLAGRGEKPVAGATPAIRRRRRQAAMSPAAGNA